MRLSVIKHKLRHGGSNMIFIPKAQQGLKKELMKPVTLTVGGELEVDNILGTQIISAFPGCVEVIESKPEPRKAMKSDKEAMQKVKEVK